jgi:hypothetical protein
MSSFTTADDFYLLKTNADGLLGIQEERPASEDQASTGVYLRNAPNPFARETAIHYNVPTTGHVSLEVRDVGGRMVESLVDETQAPGIYGVKWNGVGRPAGIYFCRLSLAGRGPTTKMILLR